MKLQEIQNLLSEVESNKGVIVEVHLIDGRSISASQLSFGKHSLQMKNGESFAEDQVSHYEIFSI